MPVTAMVTHIARASLHDGPGVRTVIYLKGCGLRCRWCHNPETLDAVPEILYAAVKCIHCGRCVQLCPEHHAIQGNDMVFLREDCRRCGKCAEACPSGALSISGKPMMVAEVMTQVRKDAHYYRSSGGGVTLSGGECLLHADFCAELLKACRAEGIHSVIETALFVPWTQVEKTLPLCDFYFADFKIADACKHRQYTGQDNSLILDNLHRLAKQAAGRVTVRIPLIPLVNDSNGDMEAFAEALAPLAEKLCSIELLRYNTLGASKYALAGKDYTDFGFAQTDEALLARCSLLEELLQHRTKVFATL